MKNPAGRFRMMWKKMNVGNRISVACALLWPALILVFLAGCHSGSNSFYLSAKNINLIFVVSPDLAYSAPGDVDPGTANLTSQGLQRSLLMATYLKEKVLGGRNVTAIFALEPTTHPQTADHYPDMAAIGYIQQFALLNRMTVNGITANSFLLRAAYAPGSVPDGVIEPAPYVPGAQGLDFNNGSGNNTALALAVLNANAPGFYVFSAPWETIRALLADIQAAGGYHLSLPESYRGPDYVYTISVTPSGKAGLITFNARLNPPSTYPELPAPVGGAACNTQQHYFSITRTGGVNGVVVPDGINTNETVYLIRHAEAHPASDFENGNFVGAGQWRALALPDFLRGKIRPDMIYSVDPAQSFSIPDGLSFSYVRPALTVLPYTIANHLPLRLVTTFEIGLNGADPTVAGLTRDFFFIGGTLSNKTVLVAWEHEHYLSLIKALLQSYGGTEPIPDLSWPQTDYDTIWRVRLDGNGNLTIDNALCEGIDSASLPAAAPRF